MKRFGAHVSIAGGIENAPLRAAAVGARAFGLFTCNQRRWESPPLSPERVRGFRDNCRQNGYSPQHILPHAGYLINLAHPQTDRLERSRRAFEAEMRRCALLGLAMLNVHPGSHLGSGSPAAALRRVAESINRALDRVPGVTVVVENTAGQGNTVGAGFEQLAAIIDGVEDRQRVGVCLDTCHAFAAGYDLDTASGWHRTRDLFERTVGIGFLRAMHLNDSRGDRGGHLDRHRGIGRGSMGTGVFAAIARDSLLEEMPLIVETPHPQRWPEEIRLLYRLAGGAGHRKSPAP